MRGGAAFFPARLPPYFQSKEVITYKAKRKQSSCGKHGRDTAAPAAAGRAAGHLGHSVGEWS